MPAPTKSLQQFVNDMVATWAAELKIEPNLPDSSLTLAFFNAAGAQLDFQTVVALACVDFARATTCQGPDLDSYMADFEFDRLPPTYAGGPVTISTSTSNSEPILIPPGTIIQTSGQNPIQFQLIADANQSAWNVSLDAYVLPANENSITATAQALVAGPGSNVQTGQLIQLANAVGGVTTVTNPSPIINGLIGEADDAYRARFVLSFFGQNWGTRAGILAAALGVQAGLNVQIFENVNSSNVSQPGTVMVIVDDGSGSPPSPLISAIQTAVNAVRPIGIQVIVQGPTKTTVTASLNIRIVIISGSTETNSNVQTNAQTALLDYINSLTIGETLYLQKLNQIAIDADPNIVTTQAGNTLIDGSQADISPAAFGVLRAIQSGVVVGTF
jgi:uncharacterized phage protein gp47/JayE